MKQSGESQAPPELLYQMVLATRTSIENPTPENRKRADLAIAKVRFSERKAAVVEEGGEYTHIPLSLRLRFSRACDAFVGNPTDENKAEADQLWAEIAAEVSSGEPVDRAAGGVGGIPPIFKPNRIPVFPFVVAVTGLLLLAALAWFIFERGQFVISGTSTPVITPTSSLTAAVGTATSTGPVIKVGVLDLDPPLTFPVTERGSGIVHDVMEQICIRLSCDFQFVFGSYNESTLTSYLAEGDVDTAVLSVLPSGSGGIEYSTPFFESFQTIYVLRGDMRFGSAGELAEGKFLVGAETGSDSEAIAESLMGRDRVLSYDTLEALGNALIAGDIDAAIADGFIGLPETLQSDVMPLTDKLNDQEIAFAFPSGSNLVARVNTALSDMGADGTLAEILDKWRRYFK